MIRMIGVEVSKIITALIGKKVLDIEDLDNIEFKNVKKIYKDRAIKQRSNRRVKKDLDDKSKQDLSD